MHPYVRLDEMWQSEYVLLDNVIVPFMLDMTHITWQKNHVISFNFDREILTSKNFPVHSNNRNEPETNSMLPVLSYPNVPNSRVISKVDDVEE